MTYFYVTINKIVFGNYSEPYKEGVQMKSLWYGKKVGIALIISKAKGPAPEVTLLVIKRLLLEKGKLENNF